tara:strand:+ start:209 stop:763 length:555 start_codon:yes stop_codon:yes gene_type:complete
MTVYANKPEFNVREKLKELDYGHVPYDKMPAGSVIQTVSETYNTRSTTTSTAFVSTGFYVEISPKFKSSKILISALTSGNNNNTVGHDLFATLYQITDNGYGGNQNLNLGHISYGFTALRTNQAASGTNNRLEAGICMGYIDSPNTTGTVKYEIWFRSESASSTVEIPQLTGQIASITAQEIKQ